MVAKFFLCCLVLIAAVSGEPPLENDATPFEFEVRSENGDFQERATVDASNMPSGWQVEAAEDLKMAFEMEETTIQRLAMLANLFRESHPDFEWQVVLNYDSIYYRSSYYIQFRMDSGVILLFAKLK